MIGPRRDRADRRRAFGLLEMLVTLALIVVFLGLGAGLIRLLLRLDRASRDAAEAATTLAALARDFRLDAHRAAPDAAPTRDGSGLILALPGGQAVTYTVRPRDVLRERREGDRLLGRDLYRLAPHATARFERPAGDGRPLLALVVRPGPGAKPRATPTQPARIVAELGRWASPDAGRMP